jgi:uncharacterized protein (TIGR02246 family)
VTTEGSKSTYEVKAREVIDSWAKAIGSKDLDGVVARYTRDILMFDLAPPLQNEGLKTIRKGLEEWFATWDGPIRLKIFDLRVTADEKIAYCTSLQRMSGTKTDGQKSDLWFRSTMCLQKIDGTFRIAHEHSSTPFYMDGSGRAALDLKP